MSETALRISSLDYLKELNTKLHHTSDYLTTALTVRRGQSFKLRLQLSRELNPQDQVVLQLSVGDRPLQAKGTLVLIPARHESEAGHWGATIIHTSQNQCEVDVRTAPNAIVGKYSLMLKIGDDYTYQPQHSYFYLLFNPWCKDDDVYLPDENACGEYVLSDMGYLYVGHNTDIKERPWNFGQFEEGVLEACVELLDKSKLGQTARSDPVRLSRAMSALVNSNDDRGVLMGNWSGKYLQGTSPLNWTGSSAILLQYKQSKAPVKYGQCWVFSGVLTTVMRCLGIPARSVTNFNSAHDTDGNLTIDIYINMKGEQLDKMTSDSIWNFHVWNDVWMKRRDLPGGYDGWQALDATPQEESGGIYQCGPCPLKAIKNGEVHLPYDARFIFAEVNADRVLWRVEGPGHTATKVKAQQNVVGLNISTKAVGQDRRGDITLLYKFAEGSKEERKAMDKACAICSEAGPSEEPRNLLLEVKSSGPTSLGSPISFSINLENLLPRPLTLTLTAAAQLQAYNGSTIATVKNMQQEVTIEATKGTSIPLKIEVQEYLPQLSDANDNLHLHVTVMAECKDPSFICTENTIISFEYPPIKVELPDTAKLGKKFTGTFTFKNTTGVAMDNCKLLVEGLGLFKLATFNQGNIAVGRIFRSEILCTPYRTGRRKIIAKIISDQISGITAEGFVKVE
ncbi:protein-glutamine gamma-glutamyltransferase 4-like [Anguilla rostrata]|uniref:protein-glutamine gamma-glutamyltransferase 4-like n=1 Tax=Anguilla rostrata TaxID=7938 RepID=UPI0030CCF62E